MSLNDSLSVTGKFGWTGTNGSQSSTIIGFLDTSRAGTTGEFNEFGLMISSGSGRMDL